MLRDHVTGELAGFKLDFPDHDLTEFPHKYEMIVQYKTRTAAHGRLISVKLHTMVYSGGAHPNNWPETWVFDLTDGHRLTLAYVFGNVNEALIAIAPGVRESLRASLGEMVLDDMLLPGTMPTQENFRDFIITDTGLTFFFAPYQVAPYAAGEQAVAVPWEQCRPFLAPSFAALLQ